jgi:hypothetical protein
MFPKERLPKSLKKLKVNKSPKHLCYPTLPGDTLTGLDFGVGVELGVDASKKDKRICEKMTSLNLPLIKKIWKRGREREKPLFTRGLRHFWN